MSGEMIQRAFALHQGGRLAEAEGLYRAGLAGGGDATGWFLYAVLLHQQQKPGDALAAVDNALRRDANHLDALMLRGALHMGLGRREAALADFAQVTKRGAGRMALQAMMQAWFNQGVALSELDRPAEAIAAFDKALALGPDPNAWNNRGAALRTLGRDAEALESFDRALALAPGFAMAAHNRVVALNELGRHAEALEQVDRLLAADPRSASGQMNRAAALFGLDRHEEAVAAYEAMLTLDRRSAIGWSNRGSALARLKRHADALASYDQALGIDADRGETWRRRGEALAALRRWSEALESFDRAAALGVSRLEGARGDALARLHRFEEAQAAYDVLIAAAPDDPAPLRSRAAVLHNLQRFAEARADFERALALGPDDPVTLQAYGKLLTEVGEIDAGMAVYTARAAALYGGGAADPPAPSPEASQAKDKHGREQAQWWADQGIAPAVHHIEGGERIPGGAVNRANAAKVAEAWAASDPKLVVIDELLTPNALDGLRRFCWGSTVWKKPYRQGYLGAFDEYGFACPLLAQIAEELAEVFPTVVGGHGLVTAWGFKYDSSLSGIRIHADQAAVNVNFWITPDEGNLNPQSGGMVVWDAVAPSDWEITKYNGDDDAVRAFLAQAGAKAVTVPYRANRAVIFDSDLFHETDRIEFAEGYLNRRINVTMLYGRRNFLNI